MRKHAWIGVAILSVSGAFAACSGGDSGSDNPNNTDGDSSLGDGTDNESGSDTPEMPVDSLRIEPATASLTVTDPATPLTQMFKAVATVGTGGPINVPATWSNSATTAGKIDAASGIFTTSNKTGGMVTITAAYGGKTATATLDIKLAFKVTTPTGPSTDLFDPSKVTVGTDPLKTPSIVYPATGTMFPQNVYKILFQWKKAGLDSFEVKFEGTSLSVAIYTKGVEADCTTAATNGGCWLADEKVWTWLAGTAAGSKLTFTVTGADSTKPGTVYKSKSIDVRFSKAPVPGAIFYWSTTVAGVRKATVSDAKPTNYLTPTQTGQCVACHTLSRNGKRLGADVGGENLWVVDVGPTFPPPVVLKADPAKKEIPNAWVTFNPDTKRIVTSAQGLLTLRDGDTGLALGKGTNGTIPLGMSNFGTMPDWSPDGKFLVFARSLKAGGRKVELGSIAIMEWMGGDTFGAPKDLVTTKGSNDNNYFPMFAPTSDWIAYGHSTGSSEKEGDSQLRLIALKGGTPFELTIANTIVNDGTVLTGISNNQPTWAPTTDSDILWIAFQSKRDYGFVLGPGSKFGAGKNQLWVAAIDVSKLGTGDPSLPAFRLPFQELTENNHRPFWALDTTLPPPPDDAGVPDSGTPPCLPQFADCSGGGICCEPYTCDVAGEFKYACK
jgi:hypothetical protein